jgi:hypothetical protein
MRYIVPTPAELSFGVMVMFFKLFGFCAQLGAAMAAKNTKVAHRKKQRQTEARQSFVKSRSGAGRRSNFL